MKLTCLAITCGGTGGHFYPGLSIARVFQRQDGEVLLLLSGVNSEKQREIAESYGVPAVVLPRMPSPKHARQFAAGLAGGVTGAYRELGKFRPQALLGMGSFASFPAILPPGCGGFPVSCMTAMPGSAGEPAVEQTGEGIGDRISAGERRNFQGEAHRCDRNAGPPRAGGGSRNLQRGGGRPD